MRHVLRKLPAPYVEKELELTVRCSTGIPGTVFATNGVTALATIVKVTSCPQLCLNCMVTSRAICFSSDFLTQQKLIQVRKLILSIQTN